MTVDKPSLEESIAYVITQFGDSHPSVINVPVTFLLPPVSQIPTRRSRGGPHKIDIPEGTTLLKALTWVAQLSACGTEWNDDGIEIIPLEEDWSSGRVLFRIYYLTDAVMQVLSIKEEIGGLPEADVVELVTSAFGKHKSMNDLWARSYDPGSRQLEIIGSSKHFQIFDAHLDIWLADSLTQK